MCEKCSIASSAMDKCFCKDNHLCSDDTCTSCEPRIKCTPGNQLMRFGKVFLLLLLLNEMTRVHYDPLFMSHKDPSYLWVFPWGLFMVKVCGGHEG